MSRRWAVVVAASVLAAGAALPAGAGGCRVLARDRAGRPLVRACTQQAWLHAPSGPTGRVDNVAGAARAAGLARPPYAGWNTHRPTASLAEGGGAVAVADPAGNDAGGRTGGIAGAGFAGTFTGALDSIAVDLYAVLPARSGEVARAVRRPSPLRHGGPDLPVHVLLQVDGLTVRRDVELWLYRPLGVTSRVLYKAKFAFTGLYPRTGRTPRRHRVHLQVVPDELRHDEALFLYDATDVPSSVTFNAPVLTGYARVPVG